ncbi:TonB-dependent receptor [Asticcacaulis excentricus]|uniref:TonB-dependent receptor n=1 Tax=Asticcacaulis excentricus TaxID=78587 RepID=UPI000F839EFE|nr:TonB-dependent receptor [Asticcacaulis excentricus]
MKRVLFITACLFPLIATSALAQSDPETVPQDTRFNVGQAEEVIVAARRTTIRSRLYTSVDVLSAKAIEAETVENSWALFGRLPGVLLTDFGQGTSSGRFSIRGFNGEGELNAVKLLIDGVPSNTNDGAITFIDSVFPLEITAAELVRGTVDPRYGLNNIAGNASLTTRSGGDYRLARITVGSFSTQEVQTALGIQSGALTQNYALNWRQSDGFRDHAHMERKGASAKLGYTTPSGASHLWVSGRYYTVTADEPGYLTGADARTRPQLSYGISQTDGDERTLSQIIVGYDGAIGENLTTEVRAYHNRFDDTRYIRFSASASQQERIASEKQSGVTARVLLTVPVQGWQAVTLEAGADLQTQDVISQRYLTVQRSRTSQTRNQAYGLDTYGAYIQAVLEPTSRLRIVPAVRLDQIRGGYYDYRSGVAAPVNDYGTISQPKLSVSYAISPQVLGYANWGRTFQIGVGSGSYLIPPRTVDLEPSINEGWEAGLKFSHKAVNGRIAVWQQEATGEVKRKLNDPLGDSENLGATRREGVDVQVSAKVTPTLSLWGALAWQKAKIITPDPAVPAALGKTIDHVPAHIYTLGVDWQATSKLLVSLAGNAQDSYYLEQTNTTGRFGAYSKVNATVVYALTSRIDVQAEVKNLTDAYSEYVWWDGSQTLHSPADPRAAYLSLRLKY